MFTIYAVEIGDSLWNALYSHLEEKYPDGENCYCSVYRIEGIFEENGQKFAIIQSRANSKYYRLNFTLTEETGFMAQDVLIEVTKSYTPVAEPQFAATTVEEFAAEYAKKKAEEKDKADKEDKSKTDKDSEEKCPECGKPLDECECDDDEDKKKKSSKYNLEEVVEYVELNAAYEELQTKFSALEEENATLKAQIEPLVEFKKAAEKKDKEDMIASFYMLSDEDKADVINNIDTYSVDDIEAKLSIICVRNKVNFDLDENKDNNNQNPTVFNLNGGSDDDDASIPAWVKAAIAVSEKKI